MMMSMMTATSPTGNIRSPPMIPRIAKMTPRYHQSFQPLRKPRAMMM